MDRGRESERQTEGRNREAREPDGGWGEEGPISKLANRKLLREARFSTLYISIAGTIRTFRDAVGFRRGAVARGRNRGLAPIDRESHRAELKPAELMMIAANDRTQLGNRLDDADVHRANEEPTISVEYLHGDSMIISRRHSDSARVRFPRLPVIIAPRSSLENHFFVF